MSSSIKKTSVESLSILALKFTAERLVVEISDGREVSVPISWFPKLVNASNEDLHNFEISPSGYGVHWPSLDEDISVKTFIGI
ncbi:MAG: DUF2442 domain-containing protein [Bacteriovoracaceae bacterium]